jgi:AAA+ ATPase superfamily predicted ATPase
MTQDNFPLGLALGEAFCNRLDERHHLLSNIKNAKPTLIISPRRYGKTSLALQTIAESKLPYAHIDFFSELTEKDIEVSILKGIGRAIGKITPAPQRALAAAKEFFADMRVKLTVQGTGIAVELDYDGDNTRNQLRNMLLKFDQMAAKYKKKVILFMDEFQRVGQIADNFSIEAVIRQVAQQSKNVIFIFSGSNRHLLKQLFEDKNRPFYKLCDRIVLERITAAHYQKYINHAAQKRWRRVLTPAALELILEVTELHPYYINLLCSRLWLSRKFPTESEVINIWNQLAGEEKSQVSAELDLLSNNQRKLLIGLAKLDKTKTPLSKEFTGLTDLPTSSIAQSLLVLEQKDYIGRDAEGFYHLIDPMMRKIITNA